MKIENYEELSDYIELHMSIEDVVNLNNELIELCGVSEIKTEQREFMGLHQIYKIDDLEDVLNNYGSVDVFRLGKNSEIPNYPKYFYEDISVDECKIVFLESCEMYRYFMRDDGITKPIMTNIRRILKYTAGSDCIAGDIYIIITDPLIKKFLYDESLRISEV